MPLDPHLHPQVLCSLAAASEAHPTARKLLVCGSRIEGLQLLRTLTAAHGGWIGWTPFSPGDLALEICRNELTSGGVMPCDPFDLEVIVDGAFDQVIAEGRAGPLAPLADAAGLRQAVRSLVQELRMAGVSPERIRGADLEDRAKSEAIATILESYEKGLFSHGLTDPAGFAILAISAIENGAARLPPNIFIAPGMIARGLHGRFLELLISNGAGILEADPVLGLPEPPGLIWKAGGAVSPLSYLHYGQSGGEPQTVEVEFFRSAGTADEVREVLRRVVHGCESVDSAEAIATRRSDYAPIFDSFSRRVAAPDDAGGFPVSYSAGLGLERTSVGAIVSGYLRWISEGFPSVVIRQMLESGAVHPSHGPDGSAFEGIAGFRLASRMRELRIGWGRDRYADLLDLARKAPEPEPRDDQDPDEAKAKWEQRTKELKALRYFFERLLAAAPDPMAGAVSPAKVAEGLLTLLEFSRPLEQLESRALAVVRERLGRIRETMGRPVECRTAVSRVSDSLDIGVPATDAAAGGAWVPVPGHLHLSGLGVGGLSGRRRLFVIGMDADRTRGPRTGNPLLGDADRVALADGREVGPLPTTDVLVAEDRFLRAAALARLRGRVTFSYPGWDAADGRAVAPGSDFLKAYRLFSGQPEMRYGEMEDAVSVAGAIPHSVGALDARDLWLAALSCNGSLRDGRAVVRAAYPELARGVAADSIRRNADEPSAHHGLLSEADPADLDPRLSRAIVVSASALETLGACPHRYFLRYVLGIRPPDDPTYEPDQWLDALQRGSLLHEVFEKSLLRSREDGVLLDDPRFEEICRDVLAAAIAATRLETPVPSEMVFLREQEALQEDVRCFAEFIKDDPPSWLSVEQAFGFDGQPPATIQVRGGEIRVRGKIDRIDDLRGAIRVVDYKSGGSGRYSTRGDPYNGGRRLQHAIYGLVAESLHPDLEVEVAEYQFPTTKGEGARSSFSKTSLGDRSRVLSELLDITRSGAFLPTDDPSDCQWCDYVSVCRVRGGKWDTDSPLAAWAEGRIGVSECYAHLRFVREGFDDGS